MISKQENDNGDGYFPDNSYSVLGFKLEEREKSIFSNCLVNFLLILQNMDAGTCNTKSCKVFPAAPIRWITKTHAAIAEKWLG